MKHSGGHIICSLLAVTALMTSCRDELCYNHFPAITMQLSWEREWERDYGMNHSANWNSSFYGFEYHSLRPGMPEWVKLIKYTDEMDPNEGYLPPDGATFALNEQPEQMSYLLYNGDTEYIVLQDIASLSEARASTTTRTRNTLSAMQTLFKDTRSINPPDVLFASFVENVPKVELHENRSLPVKMQPLVYTYVVRYEFEKGKDYVALARGALGGMAESVYLRDGSTSDKAAIILYDCDITSYGCEAKVRSFGVPSFPDRHYGKSDSDKTEPRSYALNLEVKLHNGKMLEFDFDITDQISSQPRGGVITVSGIKIEDEDGLYESGFDIDVSGWGEHEDIDLPVGVME